MTTEHTKTAEGFPPRIWALLIDVADRNPQEGLGLFEDGNGEPMQDDADAAIAWIKAAAPKAPPADPAQQATKGEQP